MTLWSAAEIGQALTAPTKGAWEAERVVIDSRKIKSGDLFVAIKGENHDGHAFVEASFEKGAVAAIVSQNIEISRPLVEVPNTFEALQMLGKASRKRARAKIAGVTGSVGKTSCKEALKLALGAVGSVYATEGNLNNHFGVPLTLANMPGEVDFAVIEMGMNHAGEITPLSEMTQPHVAIIVSVEAAHLEFFDSVAAISDAKSEISAGLVKEGTLILPRDNPHFERMQAAAKNNYKVSKIRTFGEHKEADYKLTSYAPDATGSTIEAEIHGVPVRFRIGAVGKHWAVLMMGVLAVVEHLGADLPNAMQALERFTEQKGRGASEVFPWREGNIVLVDDSYNASPASMRAAFARLAEMSGKRRKIAVLGDMLELGDASAGLHRGLAEDLTRHGIQLVFASGTNMKMLYQGVDATMRGAYAEQADMLLEPLMAKLEPGDIVLLKGSHGSGTYKLAEKLQDRLKNAVSGKERADAL